MTMEKVPSALKKLLGSRIVVLDGAMGTMIQKHRLGEKDFRGFRFQDHPCPLKGNNDLLSLTRPDLISDIHRQYLEAGADIIETNTFSSTSIAQADYQLQHLTFELNEVSARLAKEACLQFAQKYPTRSCFVAGAIGPTNRTASMSPDVNDPSFRATTFDELVDSYYEQIDGLVAGGIDLLMVETIFDTLNAKAAFYAIDSYSQKTNRHLPVMISVTITDASGRTLSGQTIDAFWYSVRHVKPLSVGINCALGASEMRPYIENLSRIADCYISCYPNAGLPNPLSETGYDETPEITSRLLAEFAESGLINIVGGCCGTTPEHINAIKKRCDAFKPRRIPQKNREESKDYVH